MTSAGDFEQNDVTEPLHPSPPSPTLHDDVTFSGADVPVLASESSDYAAREHRYSQMLGRRLSLCWWGWRVAVMVVVVAVVTLGCSAVAVIVSGTLAESHRAQAASDSRSTSGSGPGQSSGLAALEQQTHGQEADRSFGDASFSFDDLLALSNYALNRAAGQSSVFPRVEDIPELDGGPDFAVDGCLTTCARTDAEVRPVWYVDMGQILHVRVVRLYGSDVNRLNNVDVYVGNSVNVTDNPLCARLHGNQRALDVRATCQDDTSGRYVAVMLRTKAETPESLVICEVLVYLR